MPVSAPLHKLSPAGKDCTAEAAALLRSHREQARAQHFEEAARLVEAYGCLCYGFCCVGVFEGDRQGSTEEPENFIVDRHDPRCPEALAAMLREKGGARG